MDRSLSKPELEAAYCWEADDRVPQRPGMTDFRRRLRYSVTVEGLLDAEVLPAPTAAALRQRYLLD